MAQWLSWLERRPVTAEVESSSLFWVVSLGTCRVFSRLVLSCSLLACGIFRSLSREVVSFGVLAQLGEHLPYKQRVIGSSPIGPIHLKNSI